MATPLEIYWYFLPAMLANLFLYLTSRVFGQDSVLPLDLGLKVAGKRPIGDGRGLTSLPRALAAGVLCGALQGRMEEAVLLAIGAQAGMVVNSLVKRARGLPRGANFHPWDNIDFVLGACLFVSFVQPVTWEILIAGSVYCGMAHWILGNFIRSLFEGK